MYCDIDLTISSSSWSLEHEMWVKDTNNNEKLVDHVKMNSWCKLGECSTPRYCETD